MMLKLTNSTNTFGPFESVTQEEGGYQCDGAFYPLTVVGECQIEEWTGPIPLRIRDLSKENKKKAEELLTKTDWTATVDISDPQYANPYLTNQAEFLAYRSQVRAIAVAPPKEPADFPEMPVEQWSNKE